MEDYTGKSCRVVFGIEALADPRPGGPREGPQNEGAVSGNFGSKVCIYIYTYIHIYIYIYMLYVCMYVYMVYIHI